MLAAQGSAANGGSGGESASVTKLFESPLVTQIGWLYPAAIVGVVLGVVRWWPRRGRTAGPRREAGARVDRAMLVALIVWTITSATFLSAARVPHTAYVAGLGVPLALLAALAWREVVRLRSASRLWPRLAAPLLLVGQGAWWTYLSVEGRMPVVLVAATVAVWAAGLVAGIVAAARSRHPVGGRRGALIPAMLALAVLCGPVAFSTQVIDSTRDGSGGDASVGLSAKSPHPDEAFTPSSWAPWGGEPSMSRALTSLVQTAQEDGGAVDGRPLFVSDSWALSAPVIVATGDEVLTDGGYSGSAPVFSETALRAMVSTGRAHLFVVGSKSKKGDPVRALVRDEHCQSENTWDLTAPKEGGETFGVTSFTLYSCS